MGNNLCCKNSDQDIINYNFCAQKIKVEPPISFDPPYKGILTWEQYQEMYKDSIENNEQFWAKQAQRIDWIRPFTKVKDCSYENKIQIKWFYDGSLNVSYNCIDRHIKNGKGDQVAIIWEGNNPAYSDKITYRQLYARVCKFANVLKNLGVKRGDRVTIYMPMIPELAYCMLACTRIGAVHSIVFGGFSANSIAGRIDDCKSDFVVTADEGLRGEKSIPLKSTVDEALKTAKHQVKSVLVVQYTKGKVNWNYKTDVWYHELLKNAAEDCPCEEMNAEDHLFILYTSGSTGKPKGVLHTTGGYLVYTSLTHQYVFGYQPGQIYWCTADVGWITGHSYIIYGPLSNCATTVMFEGLPVWPTNSRIWEIVDKHQINILYTAPTLIRSLMSTGDQYVKKTSRKSLQLLGTVGEPINPEAWLWYYRVCGEERCPIIDTWWQTETGGFLITPLAGVTIQKPGSATFPFFGIVPTIVEPQLEKQTKVVKELKGECEGALCIAQSWPGQMRTVYGDDKRFEETYFSAYKGKYFTGDGCRRDKDGYYWITGRIDDIVIVSGHNLSTAEIESALVAHKAVGEAALVGYPHDITGQGLYAYVMLKSGFQGNQILEKELQQQVRQMVGAIAHLGFIQFVKGLPKTRSGKIMRRILRKVACNEFDNLGDTQTLLDPSVVDDIIKNRKNIPKK